jgi:PEP-CTERM motif-containing protein
MKFRLLICAVLLTLMVAPAFADSLSFTNQGFSSTYGGSLSASSSGINVLNSQINTLSVNGMQVLSGDIGVLSLDTGIFTGSLNGGSFTGGHFSFGQTPSDVIMFNNFVGTLTKIGKDLYDLVGTFSATIDGVNYIGSTNQIFSFSGDDDHGRHHQGDDDCWKDLHGTTTITTAAVPEPSTLTFFGTGLIALAGAVRRKLAGRV